MADIEELVEKFRAKLLEAQEAERYRNEVVSPRANKIFNDDFVQVFENLVNEINEKIDAKVLTFVSEGKTRFIIEGQYHRIYFQRGKIDVAGGVISVNIIPIYIWKGVTKHLGPITFFTDAVSNEVRWDIPFNNAIEYAKNLFGKLIDDEDFSM